MKFSIKDFFSKCDHSSVNFLQIFRTQKSFLEVIYKSSCSAIINAVMKYLNFRSSGSKLESVTCKFTKICTPSQYFFKEFHYNCRTVVLNILMAASEDNIIFEILLNGCFSKIAAKIYYLRNSNLHISLDARVGFIGLFIIYFMLTKKT